MYFIAYLHFIVLNTRGKKGRRERGDWLKSRKIDNERIGGETKIDRKRIKGETRERG